MSSTTETAAPVSDSLLQSLQQAVSASTGADAGEPDAGASRLEDIGVDLYWLPLGAGGHSVKFNGRVFEAVAAALARRSRCDLYHSALEVRVPEGRYVIEMTPVPDGDGARRGVVVEAPVGARFAGRFRIFRYEVRRWRDGVIPDVGEAVDSPHRVTADPEIARHLLELVPDVPPAVWGRDELNAGEMWNSNSLIAWLLSRAGLSADSIAAPSAAVRPVGGPVSSSRAASRRRHLASPCRRKADPYFLPTLNRRCPRWTSFVRARRSKRQAKGGAMSEAVLTPKPAPISKQTTMRAAVVHSFTEPLLVTEVPKPVAAAGEVVVKIEASGLCHTDIHAAHGDWPVKPNPPFTPGHEGVGIVESVGPAVSEVAVGDRVAIPWLGYACGSCEYCVSGWETLCQSQQNTGYSIDGGFAEYVKANASYVVKVPVGIEPAEAAPLTCAGVTTYKAVKVSGARPSDLVAVFGIGGLGHLALQYARIAGARVVAVDVVEEKLSLARELGAEFTVNAASEDPDLALQELGGVDAAIATAVSPNAFEQAYRGLKRGGTLVFVGLPAENHIELPIFETVLNGITVVGSIVGTRLDLREVFELHAAGKTRVVYEERPLADVNDAIADVEAGRVPARLVLRP